MPDLIDQKRAPAIWFPAIQAGSGADIFTERLAEALQRLGYQTEITWLPHRAEYAPWSVAHPQPPIWANIAHVNTWLPPRFLPTHIPYVATVHACVHDPSLNSHKSRAQALYHRHWIRGVEANTLRQASEVVAVSHYTAQQISNVFSRNDAVVIHNGIDLNGPFQPDFHRTAHHPFRVLYVGNWSRRKGADLLAPIMEILGRQFILYYTEDRNQSHMRYVLPASSHCLGRIEDPARLAGAYRDADVLLFPSRLEGFGLVALEAQACGLPVIATRGSSLPEVIQDGVTGLLCPANDAKAFAHAVRSLSEDPRRWQHMRRNARQMVEETFPMNSTIERYIEVYSRVLKNTLDYGTLGSKL